MASSTDTASLPGWARTLDVLSLALMAMACAVAASGGFRLHLGGLRIGVTSPLPLIVWAAVIAVGRHVAVPRLPVYREVPRRVREWSRVPAVRCAAAALGGTRPAILIVGGLAVFMIGYPGGRAPMRYFNNELLNLPVRWDAGWYLQIATEGYRYTPQQPEVQQNVVFFPAYPMMVRVAGRLLGGRLTSDILAGMLLSVSCFFGALIYLFLFARRFVGDEASESAVWLLAAYPFAIFFSALYTESLFLLGTTAAFYHFSKEEFGIAAAWGALVGLTRVNGAMLAPSLLVLAASPWLPAALLGTRSGIVRPSWKAFAAAAAPCVGLFAYVAFVWVTTGDPLAWLTSQSAWGRRYQSVTTLVKDQYTILANAGFSGYASTPGYDVLNAPAAIFAVAALWPVGRRLGLAYSVFIFVNIMPALAAGSLMSSGRFSSVLFPAFIWLGDAIPRRHRVAWIASFAAIQAFNSALFHTWRPLF
jgi:Mannosyltransferase (PIG-V)